LTSGMAQEGTVSLPGVVGEFHGFSVQLDGTR
jgi:hypothetical protein